MHYLALVALGQVPLVDPRLPDALSYVAGVWGIENLWVQECRKIYCARYTVVLYWTGKPLNGER